ncbi:MAG: hypothetical protein P4L51_07510 [Puia sp.]|nr:hypothetical protein [Puia sp.]
MDLPFFNTWVENRRERRVEKNTLTLSEIGWTIQVPVNCRLLKAREMNERCKRGVKIMQKLNKDYVPGPAAVNMFYAVNERYNLMACTLTPVAGLSEFEKYTVLEPFIFAGNK